MLPFLAQVLTQFYLWRMGNKICSATWSWHNQCRHQERRSVREELCVCQSLKLSAGKVMWISSVIQCNEKERSKIPVKLKRKCWQTLIVLCFSNISTSKCTDYRGQCYNYEYRRQHFMVYYVLLDAKVNSK